ncbi:MAG: DUF3108 domain-containing protein [Rhodobacteraceae bacterium]|nr:DUF3108 domain-containing protein [Paracoccaceae bacterium]
MSMLAMNLFGPAFAEIRIDRLELAVSVGSFRVADLDLDAKTDGSTYSISAALTSSGFVNWFTRIRYDGKVHGRVSRGRLSPLHYAQTTVSGDNKVSGSITYRNGAPVQIEKSPPAPIGAPKASIVGQAGTFDILTATYLVLRNSEMTEICDHEFFIYDGTRRVKIELGPQIADEGFVSCNCKYVRIDGFSEKELAEQTEVPFRLQYRPSNEREGWFEIARLTSVTNYGALVVVPRK